MPECSNCKGGGTVLTAQPVFCGLHAEVDCPKCKGTGKVDEPGVCKRCNGSKKVLTEKPVLGGLHAEVTCPDCAKKPSSVIDVQATVTE